MHHNGMQTQKLALAPKIKGGAIAQKKRNTDFPVASEIRIWDNRFIDCLNDD